MFVIGSTNNKPHNQGCVTYIMNITKRYFLSKEGVVTGRMQGKPGNPHIEAASDILGPIVPGSDWYTQMFALKFARVAEDGDSKTLYVDAPYASEIRKLTKGQVAFIREKEKAGWTIVLNSQSFIATRDKAGLTG